MKVNLEDLTFLIPIRLDSIARLENLLLVIDYIKKSFKTNIIVLEASSYNNKIIQKILGNQVEYIFEEDKDPIFYRTMYLNKMTQFVKSKYLGIWDSDVIIDKKQIVDSMDNLRNKAADIAYPYDGRFIETTDIIKALYIKKKSIKILHKYIDKMNLLYGSNHIGGAIIVNKDKYKAAGGENEKFYGWGPEDFERYHRWTNLNYNIYRSHGPLFHFPHPRGINSGFSSDIQMEIMNYERWRIANSTTEEIFSSLNIDNSI